MRSVTIELPCAVCHRPATRHELVAPGDLPSKWSTWEESTQSVYLKHSNPAKWNLLFKGITGGNGLGDTIEADEAERITQAFQEPFSYARIRAAGLSDNAGCCDGCEVAYCYHHWNTSESGYGRCPRGHGKSLDPHWHP